MQDNCPVTLLKPGDRIISIGGIIGTVCVVGVTTQESGSGTGFRREWVPTVVTAWNAGGHMATPLLSIWMGRGIGLLQPFH